MLDIQTQQLIEQRVANDGKSKVVALLFWFFASGFGAHRLYLGKTGTGLTMIALLVLGFVTFGITWLPLIVWVFIDLFLISGMVDESRSQLRNELIKQNQSNL